MKSLLKNKLLLMGNSFFLFSAQVSRDLIQIDLFRGYYPSFYLLCFFLLCDNLFFENLLENLHINMTDGTL